MSARLLLAVDASAGPASVAVFRDGVLVESDRIERTGSAEMLAPTVAALLVRARMLPSELTDVAVGSGPGSFTGLRVAAAFAKGLARGAGAALHAMPSLALIAAARDDAPPGEYWCVLDALRGEWFVQRVTRERDGGWSVVPLVERMLEAEVVSRAASCGAELVGPPIAARQQPDAVAALRVGTTLVSRDEWEPNYGRLAEAQVKWELAHSRALPAS